MLKVKIKETVATGYATRETEMSADDIREVFGNDPDGVVMQLLTRLEESEAELTSCKTELENLRRQLVVLAQNL